jgi:hypothetical protein
MHGNLPKTMLSFRAGKPIGARGRGRAPQAQRPEDFETKTSLPPFLRITITNEDCKVFLGFRMSATC